MEVILIPNILNFYTSHNNEWQGGREAFIIFTISFLMMSLGIFMADDNNKTIGLTIAYIGIFFMIASIWGYSRHNR